MFKYIFYTGNISTAEQYINSLSESGNGGTCGSNISIINLFSYFGFLAQERVDTNDK